MHRWRAALIAVLVCAAGCTSPASTEAGATLPGTDPGIAPIACATADLDIATLCTALDLIERRYVDRVNPNAIARAGLEPIRALPGANASSKASCPDHPVAGPICGEIRRRGVDAGDGVEAALRGIAHALDPHSGYLDPLSLNGQREEIDGAVDGIGALVEIRRNTRRECAIVSGSCRLVVVSTFPGSPARRAGLRPGDRVLAVDGRGVEGLGVQEVVPLVRGRPGSSIVLGILRAGIATDIRVTRATTDVPALVPAMVGTTGYLRVAIFPENIEPQLRAELGRLAAAGAHSVILDLRDNPGGSLHSAVETVSAFVGGGAVVKMESNEGEIVYAGSSSDPTELPLLVLVNAGSASASEMAAAVLAERGRATVVGERSHGKNTVQRLFPLPNGGAIKLTVGRCSPPRARTWEASASSRSSSSTSLRIWARPPSWRP